MSHHTQMNAAYVPAGGAGVCGGGTTVPGWGGGGSAVAEDRECEIS